MCAPALSSVATRIARVHGRARGTVRLNHPVICAPRSHVQCSRAGRHLPVTVTIWPWGLGGSAQGQAGNVLQSHCSRQRNAPAACLPSQEDSWAVQDSRSPGIVLPPNRRARMLLPKRRGSGVESRTLGVAKFREYRHDHAKQPSERRCVHLAHSATKGRLHG